VGTGPTADLITAGSQGSHQDRAGLLSVVAPEAGLGHGGLESLVPL